MKLTNAPDRPLSRFARLGVSLAFLPAALFLAGSQPAGADDTHPPSITDTDGTNAATDLPAAVPLPPANPPPPVTQENGQPIFSVYVGGAKDASEHVAQYEQWLGRQTDAILCYTGDRNWSDYEGSIGWGEHVLGSCNRRYLWSVAFKPKTVSLEQMATGAYNDHWKTVATKIAAWQTDQPVIYIRTAWEFNGNWFHYKAVGHVQAFIQAWRQFVTVFRSVSPKFRFDWCPAGCDHMAMQAEDAYPGDDYVDIIGLDVYDQKKWRKIEDPRQRFETLYLNGDHGLKWHQEFARQHNKPMSYPEWGSGGALAGDNPYFIEQMYKWFIDNHVIYASYWNSNSAYNGMLSTGAYPQAGEKYKELFGPQGTPTINAPAAYTGPAPATVPANAANVPAAPAPATNAPPPANAPMP
jgi:hypothetical protein